MRSLTTRRRRQREHEALRVGAAAQRETLHRALFSAFRPIRPGTRPQPTSSGATAWQHTSWSNPVMRKRRGTGPVIALLICLGLGACRFAPRSTPAVPRFIVSGAPLGFIDGRHPGLCVAVDPSDPKGVWWWEPGRSGCSSRSTGPDVFPANDATVTSRRDTLDVEVRFRVQLIVGPGSKGPDFRDVRLVLRDGRMEVVGSTLSVSTLRRHDLLLPESAPFR